MTDPNGDTIGSIKPPYISFVTLKNLWERLESAFPARIDKSYLESTAGGYATVVLQSLRWLGMLEEDGRPTQLLKDIVAAPEAQRKALFADVLRERYPGFEEHGAASETQQQLLDLFHGLGVAGDTRRKGIAFYLAGSKWAGVAVSPFWKTPSSVPTGGRKPKVPATLQASGTPPVQDESQVNVDPVDERFLARLSTALRGVLERLPSYGESWSQREHDMFMRNFEGVLEWDYPVGEPVVATAPPTVTGDVVPKLQTSDLKEAAS